MNTGHWLNLKALFRFLLGIAILILLINIFEDSQWSNLLYCNFLYLFLAGITSFAANIVGTLRWNYALRVVHAENQMSFIELLKLYLAGTILGFALIGGGLSLAFQAIVLKKNTNISYTKITLSLVLDRILDPFLSIIILIVACFYLFKQITLEEFSMILWILLIALSVGLVLVKNHFNKIFIFSLDYFRRASIFFQKIRSYLKISNAKDLGVSNLTANFDTSQLSVNYLILLTLFRMLFFVLRIKLIALALGYKIPIGIIIIGLIVFQLSWLLSITPGGVGIAEWGWVGILVKYGYETSDAVLLSISFRIFLVIFTILTFLLLYFSSILYQRKT